MNNEIIRHAANANRHNMAHNEGGEGYNPHTHKHDAAVETAVEAEIAALIPRYEELKAAWNAAVAKHTVNGKLDMRALPKIEAEAGVTLNMVRILKSRVEG